MFIVSFFYVICKISNFNMWTTKHLVKASCKALNFLKACSKCFAINILKFEILQITWKKWNKEHQILSFQFFINKSSILMLFVLFFHVVCKISKGYLPNLLETTLLHQISVFWVRDFKLGYLLIFWFPLTVQSFSKIGRHWC